MMQEERARLQGRLLLVAVAVIGAVVVLGFLNRPNAKTFVWAAIAALGAILVVELLLLRSHGRPAAVAERQVELPEIVIRCRSCNEVFTVVDTGERPLVGTCPNCGKQGTVKRAGT